MVVVMMMVMVMVTRRCASSLILRRFASDIRILPYENVGKPRKMFRRDRSGVSRVVRWRPTWLLITEVRGGDLYDVVVAPPEEGALI